MSTFLLIILLMDCCVNGYQSGISQNIDIWRFLDNHHAEGNPGQRVSTMYSDFGTEGRGFESLRAGHLVSPFGRNCGYGFIPLSVMTMQSFDAFLMILSPI